MRAAGQVGSGVLIRAAGAVLRPSRVVGAVLAAMVVCTITVPWGVGAQALNKPAFAVRVDDVHIGGAGQRSTTTLMLSPGSETVAAVTINVLIDPALARATESESVVAGGTCSVRAGGSVIFAGFDPIGWTERTDLCQIELVALADHAAGSITLDIGPSANPAVEPIDGMAESGSIIIGDGDRAADPPSATTFAVNAKSGMGVRTGPTLAMAAVATGVTILGLGLRRARLGLLD